MVDFFGDVVKKVEEVVIETLIFGDVFVARLFDAEFLFVHFDQFIILMFFNILNFFAFLLHFGFIFIDLNSIFIDDFSFLWIV